MEVVTQMQLKPGTRMRSSVDATEVVVVRAPKDADVDLRCGGQAMVPHGQEAGGGDVDPSFSDGTQMGKRYAGAEGELELLCTKAGEGSLSLGTEPILLKDAKPLPSSD